MTTLEPHFHASEIWVGKQAAVGAQISMPDIRGDKILWMCGHHPQRGKWSQANASQRAADFSVAEGSDDALLPCSGEVRKTMRDGGARRVAPADRWIHPA